MQTGLQTHVWPIGCAALKFAPGVGDTGVQLIGGWAGIARTRGQNVWWQYAIRINTGSTRNAADETDHGKR